MQPTFFSRGVCLMQHQRYPVTHSSFYRDALSGLTFSWTYYGVHPNLATVVTADIFTMHMFFYWTFFTVPILTV